MANVATIHHFEELQLIHSSLLPEERILFIEDADVWTQILESNMDPDSLTLELSNLSNPIFEIRTHNLKVCFEIRLPPDADQLPVVVVKGENISRAEQERLQSIVKEKMLELDAIGQVIVYPYQLVSLHLFPLLQSEREIQSKQEAGSPVDAPVNLVPLEFYHALLTSHHLISPNKRRSLQQWSSSLTLNGFAKVGYPGVIYAQGSKDNVEEFVSNVKALQWLALRVRFVEPLNIDNFTERSWKEFQKVGEVVEEMRRIGREEYVVEMGIGSAGNK